MIRWSASWLEVVLDDDVEKEAAGGVREDA